MIGTVDRQDGIPIVYDSDHILKRPKPISHAHDWINRTARTQAAADLKDAKALLDQLSG